MSANPSNRSTGAPVADHFVDQLVAEMVPGDLDWRDLVVDYPLLSLSAAAIGGFYLGWSHGDRIVEALSDAASQRVNETVDRYAEFGRRR